MNHHVVPGVVGGNRYAWFTFIDVDGGISVDAHELNLLEASGKDQCKRGGWQDFGGQSENQGQCIADAQSSERSKHHRS